MLNGLEILIERMKTHPEEFDHDGKWTEMLVRVDKHLTDEERQAIKQGFSDAARETFNELVLKGIAGEDVEWSEIKTLSRDYDSVLAYPKEKARAEKEYLERERAAHTERMKQEMEMRRQYEQRYNNAAQRNAYESSLMGGLANAKSTWGL